MNIELVHLSCGYRSKAVLRVLSFWLLSSPVMRCMPRTSRPNRKIGAQGKKDSATSPCGCNGFSRGHACSVVSVYFSL